MSTNEYNSKLNEVCHYVKNKVANDALTLENYISTENILPNRGGVIVSSGLPTTGAIEYFPEDVLVSNIRPYFKKIWFANKNGGCSADVLNFRAKASCASKYLYYLLADDRFFAYSTGSSKGTKMPRGDKTAIMNYPINLPSYPEQIAIAETLSCLDDKIELNNRINKNLEAQAQAIFKSWFVDFEPFQDGEFVDSELGKIPKGWRVEIIGDAVDQIICGKTPSTQIKENFGHDIPFITIPDMHKNIYIIKTERYLSKVGASTQKNKTLPPNSICVSCIASAGLVAITSEESQTNQQINSIICGKKINVHYMYLTMCSLSEKIKLLGSSGSTTSNLNKEQFSRMKICVPNFTVQDSFGKIVSPVFEMIKCNQMQSQVLASTRDSLLPKLMSGEISTSISPHFVK